MKKRSSITEYLAAAIFILLGTCLLLSARGIFREADVRRTKDPFGSLWTPGTGLRVTELSDSEDGHDHAVVIESGGAALVLVDAFDGSRFLATEMARRGVTVLLCSEGDSAAAWEHLKELRGGSADMALLAGTDRAEEALSLAGTLWEAGERPAAVILLGNEAVLRMAADYPGGNILVLTRSQPDEECLVAFYGSQAAAERGFDGYFGEGTARACAWDGAFGSFARRETLMRVADWKGSTLGHAVELPDGDHIFNSIVFCCTAAVGCLLLAVGTAAAGLRRRKKTKITGGGVIS